MKTYENEVDQLANAEKFLYYVSMVPRYGEKIKALHFQTSWDELLDDVDTMITYLARASKEVKESRKFKELLKIILALGNYMNAGQRGGAYGFKLNSILKVYYMLDFMRSDELDVGYQIRPPESKVHVTALLDGTG